LRTKQIDEATRARAERLAQSLNAFGVFAKDNIGCLADFDTGLPNGRASPINSCSA
jgi:hypothetical protein